MNLLRLFEISSSGLYAQRKRLDVIASNLANLETTRTENGEPYRRKMVVMSTKPVEGFDEVLRSRLKGVEIDDIVEDDAPFMKVYNPGHPDADEQGYVLKPNVDLIVEITNMLVAKRNFEANVTAVRSTKQMALKALEIGR
jgi:flagellar basal-body rod protein FlgC